MPKSNITIKTEIIESEVYGKNNILESVKMIGVKEIDYFAFSECRFLNKVVLSESIKMIRVGAFAYCKRLKHIKIPENENLVIESGAFQGTDLESVDFGARTNFNSILDNTLLIADGRCPICKEKAEMTRDGMVCETCDCRYTWDELDSFKLLKTKSRTVTRYHGGNHSTFKIPVGMTRIGTGAFDDSCVVNLELPETIETIGCRAFFWCDWLRSINFPEKVKRIEHLCFVCATMSLDSWSLEEIDYIGRSSFVGAVSIQDLHVCATMIAETAFSSCDNIRRIHLGNRLRIIGTGAFYENTSLKKIEFPKSLVTIGESAFEKCAELCEVTFQEGLLKIGESAFKDCPRISSLKIPNSVLSIGAGAFKNCKSLKSVSLPESLKALDLREIFDENVKILFRESGV